jgi:hypothetical protein
MEKMEIKKTGIDEKMEEKTNDIKTVSRSDHVMLQVEVSCMRAQILELTKMLIQEQVLHRETQKMLEKMIG